MLFILSIFAGIFGLFVTAVTIVTLWQIHSKRSRLKQAGVPNPTTYAFGEYFSRWTVFDYALLFTIGVGMLFLLADLYAVYRDRASYPPYTFSYLLCGFAFIALGLLNLLFRLSAVLKPRRLTGAASPQHREKPDHAD
jgi:hypothetical protein